MENKRTGVYEWADKSFNIQIGCENDCRYCFARYRSVTRFKQCPSNEAWKTPVINFDTVNKGCRTNYGVVMFPSTHDITSLNLSEYLCKLRKYLDAGNHVLIVSKPRFDCIRVIAEAYEDYKEQILFRFTIGSMDNEILKFWEPNAPSFDERLGCLQYAYRHGYKTSVSCEPYLDPFVVYTYTARKPFLTDSFWIGKLRGWHQVRMDDVTPAQAVDFIEPLKAAQSDTVVKSMVRMLDGQPFIQWKDSIREVMGL